MSSPNVVIYLSRMSKMNSHSPDVESNDVLLIELKNMMKCMVQAIEIISDNVHLSGETRHDLDAKLMSVMNRLESQVVDIPDGLEVGKAQYETAE